MQYWLSLMWLGISEHFGDMTAFTEIFAQAERWSNQKHHSYGHIQDKVITKIKKSPNAIVQKNLPS